MRFSNFITFLFLIAIIPLQSVAQIRADYRNTVEHVLELSSKEKTVSDSLLIASYPKTSDEHDLLHQIVENDTTSEKLYVHGFQNRDLLVEKSIRKGNMELLKAHLRLSPFLEGDEAIWFVENLDPMLDGPEINKICSATLEVVQELGKSKLHLISGLIQNCESGAWSKH